MKVIKIRVFLAINFDDNTNSYLNNIQHKLDEYCTKGRFTNIVNLHLTLQIIVELDNCYIKELIKDMNSCISKHESFNITLDSLGSFKKVNANLVWVSNIKSAYIYLRDIGLKLNYF
ncbi:2'-5' RNA ligase family protein [Clostridium estertheticum]|uniref:2'-5' RNA ligase family protein n=1 Tax=Clostridium estertheticum TaxID=238834 RepID=UPI001C0AAB80|nr:2'-5' RNA ligase family protein [Clostridium estertheticum]MBU3183650.1 hypothetical protein [Clostridium estertheticum]